MSKKNTVLVDRDVLKQMEDEREEAIVSLEMAVEIIKRQHEMLVAANVPWVSSHSSVENHNSAQMG